jgi:hypothetical protein
MKHLKPGLIIASWKMMPKVPFAPTNLESGHFKTMRQSIEIVDVEEDSV